jgi:hypothetical protein
MSATFPDSCSIDLRSVRTSRTRRTNRLCVGRWSEDTYSQKCARIAVRTANFGRTIYFNPTSHHGTVDRGTNVNTHL